MPISHNRLKKYEKCNIIVIYMERKIVEVLDWASVVTKKQLENEDRKQAKTTIDLFYRCSKI